MSNYGNIKSFDKKIKNRYSTRFMPSKILKPYKSNKGYLQVRLYKNKLNKNCFVHRIVAEAFIPNLNNLLEVNHEDENPLNNNVSNLEWCTHKENINYGNHNSKMAKSKSKEIIQYDINMNEIKRWVSMNDIKRELKLNISCVCKCCKKKYSKSYGYIWRYADEN